MTTQSESKFAAKNGRRKEAKLACTSNEDKRLAREARNRRKGMASETSRTFGAFGNLKGAEYNRFVAGTTGTPKGGDK
jgi:hypothetical protein